MAKSVNFKISSEGDCERVSKVFIEWLRIKSPELKKEQHVEAPSAIWAQLFSEIYADEIANNNLTDEAENNIIQINFYVDSISNKPDLSKLSNEELMELLEEFLEDFDEEEDNE
jgi:hypothetical protein